jgi:lipopolysaccharide export system permease protein
VIRHLDRYVFTTFTRLFFLTLLAVAPLFMLGDLTDNIDDYLRRDDVGIARVVEGYLYSFPQWFQWSLPIAALVAAVFTVSRMTANREVLAAKAGGVSFHRLFLPMLFVASAVAGIGFGVADYVPRTNRVAMDLLGNRPILRLFRDDFAFRTEGGMLLSVRRLSVGQGTLDDLVLTRESDEGTRLHIEAESGMWAPQEGVWTFSRGRVRHVFPDGRESAMRFTRMRVPALTEDPEDLMAVAREADEMTRAEIERQVGIIERSGGRADGLRVEAAQRSAIPIATLVIILFAAPLATTSKRGGAAFGVGLALGSLILYIMLLNIWGAMGAAGIVRPATAAWTPNAIFLLLGLVFLIRVRT